MNNTKAVLYKKGVHIAAIARKYSITKEQLFAYNDMGPKGKFSDGDIVYVESKKPEAGAYQYEIAKGETMHYISQKFAVQLADLLKRNGLKDGYEPLPGEIIVLRGKREYPLKYKLNGKTYSTKITATASVTSDTKTHKVGNKETLYSISKQYNIPLDTLKRINGLKDEDISVDLSELNGPEDQQVIVVTEPLTTNETWIAMAPGELRAFVDGSVAV